MGFYLSLERVCFPILGLNLICASLINVRREFVRIRRVKRIPCLVSK